MSEEQVAEKSTEIKIKKSKCFQETFAGFDCIKPINVIIGRNNSGKSALLDMIEFITRIGVEEDSLPERIINLVNKDTAVFSFGSNEILFSDLHKCNIPKPLQEKIFIRLDAGRHLLPEIPNSVNNDFNSRGDGAVKALSRYFENGVKKSEFLSVLNTILTSNEVIHDINIKTAPDGRLEVYLNNEPCQNEIPLSFSGSGLQNILLVLICLYAIPFGSYSNRSPENCIFGFEELENSLHPELLRQLYQYIEEFAKEKTTTFFITTHSSVAIDFFSRSEVAQIVHVMRDGNESRTETIQYFAGLNNILDDLGIRASDLLQANGVVWLEGPSDRIYFNKWVEIYSNGELKEHRDYECAFYGGAILAHHQAQDPNADGDFINIFRINRNAILLADRDKKSESCPLKQQVARMKKQIEESKKGLMWVFEAKEIENYIPAVCIQKAYPKAKKISDIGQYDVFYCDKACYWIELKIKRTFNKVEFAHNIVPWLTQDSLKCRFDLPEKMKEICDKIKLWNNSDATNPYNI